MVAWRVDDEGGEESSPHPHWRAGSRTPHSSSHRFSVRYENTRAARSGKSSNGSSSSKNCSAQLEERGERGGTQQYCRCGAPSRRVWGR